MKNLPVVAESNSSIWYGRCMFCAHLRLTMFSFFLIAFYPLVAPAEAPKAKNVLVMYSFSDRTEYDPIESLESAIRARAASPVNFYVEYMESQRLVDEAYRKSWAETLTRTYHGVSLDLVIAFSYPVVPLGKARIRTQISAAHTREELQFAVAKFAEAKAEISF